VSNAMRDGEGTNYICHAWSWEGWDQQKGRLFYGERSDSTLFVFLRYLMVQALRFLTSTVLAKLIH
jgi:hypothetical protein